MANVEITWTVDGQSHADITLGYDPSTVDANGNAVMTSASGTYQVLDANNNVVRTDQVTGLIAANSFLFAPDDVVNVDGKNPIVDLSGVGVLINNAADADQIGPNNTPEVEFSVDVEGDYRELQKGDAVDVTLQQTGSGTNPPSGGGSTGTTSGGGVTVKNKPNGGDIVDITAPDQTVTSNVFDTFKNHGNPGTTFVFEPYYGLDTITQFRANGTDHDTLSLPSSDFSSVVDVLNHTSKAAGGVAIHDPLTGETIKLKGVTKAELKANQQDFTFHA